MKEEIDTLREEYPPKLIKAGKRGKYATRIREGSNLVLIDSDLHKHFPDADSVNRALRDYVRLNGFSQSTTK